MQKISNEELKKLRLQGKGQTSPIYLAISQLSRGENLHITTEEYGLKTHPSALVRRVGKKFKATYSVAKILDGSGWIITRVK